MAHWLLGLFSAHALEDDMAKAAAKSGLVKCPWCGRQVSWHKGRLPRHVQSQHVQCVGSGQPQHQVEATVASIAQRGGTK
jgi:hypothetical protein